jgi:spoIIIJ-associated protein
MSEVTQQAAEYLEEVFDATGLQLRVAVKHGVAGEVLDIEGKDSELLQAQTGELLEALQHLINQVFGRSLAGGERLVCDVNGFRATREAELQAMANLAANRVRQTGMAFTFEPMSANERRIIHLTLADSEDLSTESIGEGSERKLRIVCKSSAPRNS